MRPRVPDAYKAAKAEKKRAQAPEDIDVLGTFSYEGETFEVIRKPGPLLLAEMARTHSNDPDAMAVLADFFEVVLGRDAYRGKFRPLAYAAKDPDSVYTAVGDAIQAAAGRPTE